MKQYFFPVSSSNLSSVGYDFFSQTLEIEFHGGRVYQYYDVPAAAFSGLMSAFSKGSYFYRNIRKSYRYSRISRFFKSLWS